MTLPFGCCQVPVIAQEVPRRCGASEPIAVLTGLAEGRLPGPVSGTELSVRWDWALGEEVCAAQC